ncbi:MAG: hypothetical protein HQ519_01875 [Planctomycetes bacterium]|nr:hypothetical protein [Planctomycetota bacterium]
MNWKPHIESTLPIKATSSCFIAALRERIQNGLVSGQPRSRSNYSITESTPGTIRIQAVGWWAAINIGLNDLNLNLSESGRVHFRIYFWRWAIYCLLLCFVIGLAGALLLLTIDIRDYISTHPGSRLPGLTIDQNVYFAWGNLFFWGLIWPWLLIVYHKRPLRRLMVKLVNEIDAEAIAQPQ